MIHNLLPVMTEQVSEAVIIKVIIEKIDLSFIIHLSLALCKIEDLERQTHSSSIPL